MTKIIKDQLGRGLQDLRISLTDRCNLRCNYCMPPDVFGPDYQFLPQASQLTADQILTVVDALDGHGLRKVRLTGGEPLLRKDCVELVAGIRSRHPDLSLALTTNGLRLRRVAAQLAEAGLERVNVSLDTLDDAQYAAIGNRPYPVATVVEGIEAALEAGMPVKLNAVIQRGVNDDQILPLLEFGRGRGVVVRFIEYMDVGNCNGWTPERVVPADVMLAIAAEQYDFEPRTAADPGDVARLYGYTDRDLEFGVITSISKPFCRNCNRARLSSDGRLFTCLFASAGHDLGSLLRAGADAGTLFRALDSIWSGREDRYSELRAEMEAAQSKAEMSYLGG